MARRVHFRPAMRTPRALCALLVFSPQLAHAEIPEGAGTAIQVIEGTVLAGVIVTGATLAGTVALAGYVTYDAFGDATSEPRIGAAVIGGCWLFTGSMILAFADDENVPRSQETLIGGVMLGVGGAAASSALFSWILAEPVSVAVAPMIGTGAQDTRGASIAMRF